MISLIVIILLLLLVDICSSINSIKSSYVQIYHTSITKLLVALPLVINTNTIKTNTIAINCPGYNIPIECYKITRTVFADKQ